MTTSESRDQIHQLKARYCRCIDTRNWDGLRALFTPAARFDGLGSAPSGASLDSFIAGISTRFATATSVHHCHMPEITFHDASHAHGIWAMMDYVQWPAGFLVKEAPGHPGFVGYGHYEETYLRHQRTWLIDTLRLTRLRIDPLPCPTQGQGVLPPMRSGREPPLG